MSKRDSRRRFGRNFPSSSVENLANDLAKLWRRYLEISSEQDLANSVSYRNSQGEAWSSRKDDILMHVVMHSAYHRGQIATDMRSAGLCLLIPISSTACARGL